jgi:hypothetical protein
MMSGQPRLSRFLDVPALARARGRVSRPAQVALVAVATTLVAACTYTVLPSRPALLRTSIGGPATTLVVPAERPAVQERRDGVAGSGAANASDSAAVSVASAGKAAPAASNIPSSSAAPAIAGTGAAGGTAGQANTSNQQLPPLPAMPANERMVVKNGTLSLQVSDLAAAVQRANAVIAGIPGAYVASSSTTYRADDPTAGAPKPQPAEGRTLPPGPPVSPVPPVRPTPGPVQTANLSIKVPVDAFSDALQRLRELGTPAQESVSTQEVTEEYVDLDAQVRNLEATEQQYVRLLDRAQRIEEILPIQQRLNDVRSQIERLRGRMTLLQRRADLSTITLTLVLPAKGEAVTAGEPRILRTAREALSRLGTAVAWAADAAIALVIYALPIAPFAAAYWWWRRSRSPSSPPAGAVAM